MAPSTAGHPPDNTSFFHNLTPELRRTILADMDDSIITHLPEEIASEARALRQERETRRRQILEQRHAVLERIFEQASTDHGAPYMQPASWDPSGYRYAILNLNPHQLVDEHHHHHHQHHHHHFGRLGRLYHQMNSNPGGMQLGGSRGEHSSKQMLDQEALTCLLVLLFFDQNKLHNNRLHRIMKNLSQHMPTRAWIISSLLSILQKASQSIQPASSVSHTCPMPPPLAPHQPSPSSSDSQASSSTLTVSSSPSHHPHWLNLTINAALGSHTHVFHFQPAGKVGNNPPHVHIHSLASSHICNNVLDILVFLSRQFPSSFLPSELMPNDKTSNTGAAAATSSTASSGTVSQSKEDANRVISNFWQILLRLDSAASRKGKGSLKAFQFEDPAAGCSAKELFSRAIIGQLMTLLRAGVIHESVSLTDKLLRVLSVASGPIPKTGLCRRATELLPGGATMTTKPASTSQQSQQGFSARRREEGERVVTQLAGSSSDDVFVTEEEVVEPSLLQVVIGVLTSGLCSEDGLEDATLLLTNLSKVSVNTRENILIMLLDGIRTIGLTLCSQIAVIIKDLSRNWELVKTQRGQNPSDDPQQESEKLEPPSVGAAGPSGSPSSRTPQSSNVIPGVVLPSATPELPSLVDHSKDLHLPSMVPLTCKGSQQSFFLRMLKVVCQLRESAQAALTGAQKTTGESATVAASSAGGLSAVTEERERSGDNASRRAGGAGGAGGSSGGARETQNQAMDVESVLSLSQDKSEEVRSKLSLESHSFILDSLSRQLHLDELWWALSECLDMLAQTSDPHAVLILQPSVEAFFLVHASGTEEGNKPAKKSRSAGSRSRSSGQLSLFRAGSESGGDPASPAAPRMDFSPVPSTPGLAKGEESYSHLPPDTARFLMFAGLYDASIHTQYVLHTSRYVCDIKREGEGECFISHMYCGLCKLCH